MKNNGCFYFRILAETATDNVTYDKDALPCRGIPYVIVSEVVLVKDSQVLKDIKQRQPVLRQILMMTTTQSNPSPHKMPLRESFVKRHLGLAEILNEVLFGLIMVLAFTLGAGLIVKEGHEATTQMLLGILGCNIAWGLIDGAMYVMSCMFERSRKARLLQSIQKSADEEGSLAMVGREFDDRLEMFTTPAERKHLYQAVLKRLKKVTPEQPRLKKEDIYGAIAVFWLVFFSTIPAVVPFLLFQDRFTALRVSNLLLLTMLFLVGYRWARAVHRNPWIFGSTLVLAGLVPVAIAMALGG